MASAQMVREEHVAVLVATAIGAGVVRSDLVVLVALVEVLVVLRVLSAVDVVVAAQLGSV